MTDPRRAPGGFPVVGVVGGGQLARMLQPAAIGLGVQLSVLVASADAPAALVVPSAPVGDHADVEAVRAFAARCDVVTFDHEQVPAPVLAALHADGVILHPGPEALVFAQDKLAMRARLSRDGVRCPRWARVTSAAQVADFGAEVGWPVVAKTPRGGYDGKGVRLLASAGDIGDIADWLDTAARGDRGGPLQDGVLLEERVNFVRELAVLVARSPSGQGAAWPVVETLQAGGVCAEVLAPAPGLDPGLAATVTEVALRIAGDLGVVGVLAVEMFEVRDGSGAPSYVVNELAMRPHNSGHWTIDGAVTSQFEQHLRAVLDLPLGDPSPRARWTVMANVLGGQHPRMYPAYLHVMARDPGARVHVYGKGVRPGRKLGHVTVSGDRLEDCRQRAGHAAGYLQGVATE